ncbi:unnamed protein product [Victoria cruziana]
MDSKYSKVCCTPGTPFESMDFLSRNSAVQVFRSLEAANFHDPRMPETCERNIFKYTAHLKVPQQDKDSTANADESNPSAGSLWQTDNLKSWIWLQQIIHPELKLDRCFRKKWTLAKIFRGQSIRFWLKEIKRRRKEETRLQKAEVHAAISVASVAAALAAVAAENVRKKSNCGRPEHIWQREDEDEESNNARDAVLASAAALVAGQCVEVAQTMGAKTDQLGSAIGSALTAKDVDDIITLTAAAATSLRGAATLRARTASGVGSANETVHLLQYNRRSGIDSEAMSQDTIVFDFLKGRSLLARETLLVVITKNGDAENFEDHEAQPIHGDQRKTKDHICLRYGKRSCCA